MTVPRNDSGQLIYEPFYGLNEKPFSLSTDPRFLYKSGSHTPVFRDVLDGIRRREGLVVLTGEPGTGKTTLCRSVLAALDRKTFSAFVTDPVVSREDLLKILLVEFGVVLADDVMRGRLQDASRAELSCALYEFLRSLEPLDAFAVLLVDEAHNLPVELLEEVRILADLEGRRKLLQVVLIGQRELAAALRLSHMRQLKQRITTYRELQPLDRDGLHGYVRHRLAVAGAAAGRLHVTGDALDAVFEASGGVPRAVNRLCDGALRHGHRARTSVIGSDLVRLAVAELELESSASVLGSGAGTRPHADAEPGGRRGQAARPGPFDVARGGGGSAVALAMAALLVLGSLSGVTLALYWAWAGPLMTARGGLPPVRRPSMRIAAPLPAVLLPAIEGVGDTISPPEIEDPFGDEPEAGPARPVSAPSLWTVQAGAFVDDAGATALVARLAARGFSAFKSAKTVRGGAPVYLVLVGTYARRTAAAAALDRIAQIPGVVRPLVQLVPPVTFR